MPGGLPALPVDAALPELVAALRVHGSAVLVAPPGAGKTTRVPGALLGASDGGVVYVLEPRRLAARAAARRVARERGVDVGAEVGYHVRFDRRAGPKTRILFVTEGVLLRMLASDPFLERAGAVVFDEFHERNLDSDLALAFLRRVQRELRPELGLVVMSATLDPGPVAAFLGGAPVVACEGIVHPVTIEHRARPAVPEAPAGAAAAARDALPRTPGDVLVFLPGLREIRRARDALGGAPAQVVELYGDLPPARQDAALSRGSHRRIVLATNVAETSVTVEGVSAVVDSGLARVARYDPALGLTRLEIERISRASAAQRAGRAGREGPGLCVRLWTEHDQKSLDAVTEPEVRRVDLAHATLALLALGEPDVAGFPWFDAPEPDRIASALALLERLQATEDGRLTKLGREMARLPVHPRLARLLLSGRRHGVARRCALAAALLSERDPFPRGPSSHRSESDVLDRVEAVEEFERGGAFTGNRGAARFALRARDDLLRLTGRGEDSGDDQAFLRAVAEAFLDRVARRRATGGARGVMIGGRGVRLADASAVGEAELFACVRMEAGPRGERADALVRMASRVEREWLPASSVRFETEVSFDDAREAVVATRRTLFHDLALDEAPTAADAAEAARVLAEAAARCLPRALPLAASAVASLRGRWRSLREWMPELALPPCDDELLLGLLPDLCRGRRSFAELRDAPLAELMRGRLDYAQLDALKKYAPERITVPSGRRVVLRYEPGRPPVLASRIQDLFGLAETPRVAGGRVKVLLHLLAPNGRPQQVTDDLGGFWARTYPQVRRELRGRYPKHAWPEDPLEPCERR